jgi:hypothetical protein
VRRPPIQRPGARRALTGSMMRAASCCSRPPGLAPGAWPSCV